MCGLEKLRLLLCVPRHHRDSWGQLVVLRSLLQSRPYTLLARFDGLLQEKHKMIPEPLHNRVLQHSLDNLKRELAGQSTDDPEYIDGKWLSPPLLYACRAL